MQKSDCLRDTEHITKLAIVVISSKIGLHFCTACLVVLSLWLCVITINNWMLRLHKARMTAVAGRYRQSVRGIEDILFPKQAGILA